MVVALTEIIPSSARTAGFSLAYALATALFGGFTPLMSTWLIEVTDNKAAPGFWLGFAGACGLAATIVAYGGEAVRRRAARESMLA
jgi:MHS family citrate/tricarballylate:H+ symporter-like MFS transporter